MKLLTFNAPTKQTERQQREREIFVKQNADLRKYAELQHSRPAAAAEIGRLIQDLLDDEKSGA